jgi:hypothetical protein
VIPSLKKVHPVLEHPIHQPVLVAEPSRPYAGCQILEGFGLAYALEGIAEDRLDQIE